MTDHEFPVTPERWAAYLEGHQHPPGTNELHLFVVNYLGMLHRVAYTKWPDASEVDQLRWMVMHMQDVVNRMATATADALRLDLVQRTWVKPPQTPPPPLHKGVTEAGSAHRNS